MAPQARLPDPKKRIFLVVSYYCCSVCSGGLKTTNRRTLLCYHKTIRIDANKEGPLTNDFTKNLATPPPPSHLVLSLKKWCLKGSTLILWRHSWEALLIYNETNYKVRPNKGMMNQRSRSTFNVFNKKIEKVQSFFFLCTVFAIFFKAHIFGFLTPKMDSLTPKNCEMSPNN